ncbi:MAG: sulfurtransferase complex subunit TusB [Gammaproteobacteria bacterium]|nr:sulfurtransferase complex subunit TusB [Gammaproteobacteria bacterium]
MSAILHILNKGPGHTRTQSCLHTLQAGDTLLLTEHGVTLVMDDASLRQLPTDVRLYVNQRDLTARGLAQMVEQRLWVDDARYVELCVQHTKILSW